jgi:hypothetical protein
MWLIPMDRVKIETKLSAEEVRQRLLSALSPRHWLWTFAGFGSTSRFSGRVGDERFLISLRCPYPNTYAPMLSGRIRSEAKGSSVVVTAFAPFALLIPASFAVMIFLLASNSAWDGAKSCAAGGLLVHCACWAGYENEEAKAEAMLRDLLDR